jgi:hypothetical protein
LDPGAAVVEVVPDGDDEQAANAVPAAPASTTAPPAAAPRAMKVRRLISCSSGMQTPPIALVSSPDGDLTASAGAAAPPELLNCWH